MQNGLTTIPLLHRHVVDVSIAANLKNVPLFADLPEIDLQAIAKKAVLKDYDKKVVVITEGEFTKSLYVILSGKVKVYLNDENGKELLLYLKGPGQYFGEMVLDEGPRATSVVTTEPSRFAVILMADFKNALLDHSSITPLIIKNLIQMVRGLNDNVRSLAMLNVYSRVSRMLLDLAVEKGERFSDPEKLMQREMANRVGT